VNPFLNDPLTIEGVLADWKQGHLQIRYNALKGV
jgi:hypothetical protein